MRIARAVAVATLCVAPNVAAAQKRFVAPTDQSIILDYEEGYGSTPLQIAYLRNLSSVQIMVYSVTLRECENIKQQCNSPQKVKIRIPPSGRAVLRRVEPRNPEKSFRYSLSYGWTADSSNAEALRFLATQGGSSSAAARVERHEQAAAEQQAAVGYHDEWVNAAQLVELGVEVSLHAVPDSVVLRVGQQFSINSVRIMARTADAGVLGRIAGYRWRVAQDIVEVKKDTIVARAPGRVDVFFELAPPAVAGVAKFAIVVAADSVRPPAGRR